jgi:hypothetical protein
VTANEPTSITRIPKGHRFPATAFSTDESYVAAYLNSTDDHNACYGELHLAPPLAVVAQSLGCLLEHIQLPAGSLHTGQDLQVHSSIPIAERLVLEGRLAQRSERAGFVICLIDFDVALADSGKRLLSGRTTVMAPAAA